MKHGVSMKLKEKQFDTILDIQKVFSLLLLLLLLWLVDFQQMSLYYTFFIRHAPDSYWSKVRSPKKNENFDSGFNYLKERFSKEFFKNYM